MMEKTYMYIDDPQIYAIYIKNENLLIINTNVSSKGGLIYFR